MDRMLRTVLILAFVWNATMAFAFDPSTKGKKIISYGQDWPNPAYVRAHIAEMETHPFDGVVIGVTPTREPKLGAHALGHRVWSKTPLDPAPIDAAIEDLRATKFKKFTDNFILVEAMPGDVNFFDKDFNTVLNNIRLMARVAKQGGCVGIEFDPEEYSNEHVWSYNRWSPEKRGNHTEAEYIAQARYRGDQFMGTICSEFHGPKILILFGPSSSASYQRAGKGDYRLLAAFIEGMCRGTDGAAQIIDGYEQSYAYRIPLAFEEGRKSILASREMFEDKSAFDRTMKVGFGLWTDCDSGHRGWHPDQPDLNVFQPATFQSAIYGALSYSDEYVWIWRERFNEWSGKNFSEAYDQAMRDGRQSAPKLTGERKPLTEAQTKFLKRAEDQPGFDDDATFGDLLTTQDVLLDLSTDAWRFKPDPDGQGVDQKWFASELDDSKWDEIHIRKFWEEEGFDYDGFGWYRRAFYLPAVPKDRKVELVFGAVDEDAQVWLNGEPIGSHAEGEVGWDKRFSFDVTGKLHEGRNQITVRVLDRTGPGGIWKSVKLLVSRR